MIEPLFINEQRELSIYDYAPGFRDDAELIAQHVWSPVRNRHTHWMHEPLCQCDARGNIVKGSRRRDPFVALMP